MPEKNFMTARTEMEGYLSKKDAIIEKAAAILADACITRTNAGKVSKALEKDIDTLLEGFSDSDKSEIKSKAIIHLLKNGKFKLGGNTSEPDDYRNNNGRSSSIFGNRF